MGWEHLQRAGTIPGSSSQPLAPQKPHTSAQQAAGLCLCEPKARGAASVHQPTCSEPTAPGFSGHCYSWRAQAAALVGTSQLCGRSACRQEGRVPGCSPGTSLGWAEWRAPGAGSCHTSSPLPRCHRAAAAVCLSDAGCRTRPGPPVGRETEKDKR